jgi:hypothetical protein
LLSYTPAADANGSASVTTTLSDNGSGTNTSAPVTFTITVTPVNDPPTLAGSPVTVDEDSGAYSAAWATAMSPGAANESGQTLTLTLSASSDPALFSVQPALSQAGVLSFTTALNANGVATLTATLTDDGGGTNSSSIEFTITLTSVNDPPVAVSQSIQTNEDVPVALTLNVTDVDGETLSYSYDVEPAIGFFDGTPPDLTFVPYDDASGEDSFTYTATERRPPCRSPSPRSLMRRSPTTRR